MKRLTKSGQWIRANPWLVAAALLVLAGVVLFVATSGSMWSAGFALVVFGLFTPFVGVMSMQLKALDEWKAQRPKPPARKYY